jgi:hypothetical protein
LALTTVKRLPRTEPSGATFMRAFFKPGSSVSSFPQRGLEISTSFQIQYASRMLVGSAGLGIWYGDMGNLELRERGGVV